MVSCDIGCRALICGSLDGTENIDNAIIIYHLELSYANAQCAIHLIADPVIFEGYKVCRMRRGGIHHEFPGMRTKIEIKKIGLKVIKCAAKESPCTCPQGCHGIRCPVRVVPKTSWPIIRQTMHRSGDCTACIQRPPQADPTGIFFDFQPLTVIRQRDRQSEVAHLYRIQRYV